MLYKVALTRVTTRVASNTPIRMAPFDNLDHYHRTESKLDSLIALDVSSESNANDTTAIPVRLDWHLNGGSTTRALCSARFQVPTSGGCPTPAYSRYRSPAGLPLERPDLVPFPSAPSLLDFHLPHAIVWMAENTRPMGADADEIWSSSETTMHNDPGSGKINTINTESRFRAQVENLLDAHVFSLRVRAPGYMPGQLDCLQLHASCTRDSLLRAAGTLRRQPWDNLIGTKEPHHLFETEFWLSKGFDGRDTNALSDSVELKPGARNLVPRPMFSSRPPPVSSQVQDSD
ncbi:hypothetical protein CPAR01_15837 [Colletotrichum paranaense]|uniref:Uncharacterized protein n=1 Tax=Colletotrichum paranaense TaxID=1914294 RepID=A0ABQ9RY06_9PEZI|nr:uncharacterized protein CPAR01_15837 [Colletotrichum paranaense]KAK1518188.1 hypothetical protein CPAR01_15837 [Colletotrichum paranaense]